MCTIGLKNAKTPECYRKQGFFQLSRAQKCCLLQEIPKKSQQKKNRNIIFCAKNAKKGIKIVSFEPLNVYIFVF